VFDSWDGVFFRGGVCFGGWGLHVELDLGVFDFWDRVKDGVAFVEDFFGDGRVVCFNGDIDRGDAVFEGDVFNETKGDDVSGVSWVGDLFEEIGDGFWSHDRKVVMLG